MNMKFQTVSLQCLYALNLKPVKNYSFVLSPSRGQEKQWLNAVPVQQLRTGVYKSGSSEVILPFEIK
jgi:hypothetical protein